MDRLTTIGAELASMESGRRPIAGAALAAARLIAISIFILITPALVYIATTRFAD